MNSLASCRCLLSLTLIALVGAASASAYAGGSVPPGAPPAPTEAKQGAASPVSVTPAAAPAAPALPAAPGGSESPVAPSPTAAGPRISFDEVDHDFGFVPHGTIVKHIFKYTNVGDAPLEVFEVRTSCGCTAAEPSRRLLAPGQSGELGATFDTARKSAGMGRHHYINTITVRSNDLTRTEGGPGMARLVMQGDVVARYQVIPETGIYFRASGSDDQAPITATAEIIPSAQALAGEPPVPPLIIGAEGARILGAPPSVEIVMLRPIERDGRPGVAIDCVVRPGTPPGALEGTIRLATGNPLQPEALIGVHGAIQPPVQVMPARLFLDRSELLKGRSIQVVGARRTNAVAARVDPADGGRAPFGVSLSASGGVDLTPLDGADLTSGASGDVVIFLADNRSPVLRVPYLIHDSGAQEALRKSLVGAAARVSPGELVFGDVAMGQSPSQSIIITRSTPQPISVVALRSDPPDALIVGIGEIVPGQVFRISVKPGARPGGVCARVRFTIAPSGVEISVPAYGRVLSRLSSTPGVLVVSATATTAEVEIRSADGSVPGGAIEAADVPDSIEAVVEPSATGLRVRVRLKGERPRPVAGDLAWVGLVPIRVGAPGQERIRIPVIVFSK